MPSRRVVRATALIYIRTLMSNGTSPLFAVAQQVLSLSLGGVSSVTNLLIFASIAKYSALRDDKEYTLLAALGLADSINMMGDVSFSVLRFASRVGEYSPLIQPPRRCLFEPHVLLWVFGWPLSHLLLLIISCDRLSLVSKPLYYIQDQSRRHTTWVVLASYLLALITVLAIVFYVLTEFDDSSPPRFCTTAALLSDADGLYALLAFYYNNSPQFFAYMSVVVYCIVWMVHMRGKGRVLPSDGDEQRKKKIKTQYKMTKTLGISCLCTLLLYLVPAELAKLFADALGFPNPYSTLLWVLTQTNSLANIVIYQTRHSELRTALKGLIHNKALPSNLELWPNAQ